MKLNSLYKIYLLSKMFFCQNSSHSCWKDYIWLPALDFQRFKSIQSSFPALPHCLICAFVLSSQVLQLLQSSHSQLFESWESLFFHSHFFNMIGDFPHPPVVREFASYTRVWLFNVYPLWTFSWIKDFSKVANYHRILSCLHFFVSFDFINVD